MRVGYLVNQYPKVSHSFIRREIVGIEACGIEVKRFSIRSCQGELVDPMDLAEFEKTTILFTMPPWRVLVMVLQTLLSAPLLSLRLIFFASRLGWCSNGGLLKHWAYFLEACVVRRWCSHHGIDHLHAHFGTNSASIALLCHRLGGPSYSFTVHGPEEFDRAPNLYLSEKILHASFVIAISSFGRSQLYRLCPHDQWSKIKVIRCGIDDLFLQQRPAPLTQSPRLVCVGRLCPEKGQLLLVEAMRELRDLGLECHLTFVGDGALRGEIEQLVADYQLGGMISITGWVGEEQVRAEILGSLALVLPSLAEGLPVVIMESLGLGRPVLSTYIAGIPELVEPGVNGWLIPAGTVGELTQALATLLKTDPCCLQNMGQAGQVAVAQKHNIYRETRALAALFRQSQMTDGQALAIDWMDWNGDRAPSLAHAHGPGLPPAPSVSPLRRPHVEDDTPSLEATEQSHCAGESLDPGKLRPNFGAAVW